MFGVTFAGTIAATLVFLINTFFLNSQKVKSLCRCLALKLTEECQRNKKGMYCTSQFVNPLMLSLDHLGLTFYFILCRFNQVLVEFCLRFTLVSVQF